MTFFFLLNFFTLDDWAIKDTEIFHPISSIYAATSREHQFVFIDLMEKSVLRYGPDGKLLGPLAKKGPGPEEIAFPMMVFYQEPYFLVLDDGALKLFDNKGFVRSLPVARDLLLFPAAQGFVQMKKGNYLPVDATNTLEFRDMELGNPIPLHAWQVSGLSEKHSIRRTRKAGKVTPSMASIANTSMGKVSRDGYLFYFKQVGTARILIFDLVNKTLRRTLELSSKTNLEVGRLMIDPDENLWVFSREPDSGKNEIHIFDRNGEPTQARFSNEESERILKIDGDQAYVSVYYHDNEDFGVRRCKLDRVQQFIKDHPLVLD